MSHLIKNLMHVMEKKISLYDKYIMVLENEWECVVGYSLEPLEKILNEKNDLVERMQKLEADRFKLMKKISETLGIPQENLNLMKLA
ncbi:MAG: flagellar export chaperone FlgN [Nitrospinota bacterium]|nr:flagellar export chaperone FlgN [Nitrospinota bacterium]